MGKFTFTEAAVDMSVGVIDRAFIDNDAIRTFNDTSDNLTLEREGGGAVFFSPDASAEVYTDALSFTDAWSFTVASAEDLVVAEKVGEMVVMRVGGGGGQ